MGHNFCFYWNIYNNVSVVALEKKTFTTSFLIADGKIHGKGKRNWKWNKDYRKIMENESVRSEERYTVNEGKRVR